ncbi:MAG: response regulator [Verrucomicrobiota bacterium]|jgi:FixJ family two-component response regulator
MNNGHPLNNGENRNKFPLVRKPASAVEKAAPGAKRILSGMVADTLALTKNKKRKKLRIVVLDDEEGARQGCVAMLKSCWPNGAEILEFGDSLDAWQELSRTDPDLFITDIRHAGISCTEMLTRLAARKIKYPILVISASHMFDVDTLRGWGSGLNVSFLSKPITVKQFHAAIETALKIKITRDAAMRDETMSIESRSFKRRGTLLVVDDEEGVRESMRVIFEDEYDLFMAEDGVTAIKLAQENDIDVVVTNIHMPGMSGIELLKPLKYRRPDIEVIMMTGMDTTDTRRMALRLGACDFINKPFDATTIRAAVSKAMQRRTLESEITAAQKKSSSNTEKIPDQPPQTHPLKIIPLDYENIVGEFTDFLASHSPLIGDCSLLPYPKKTIHYAIASVLNDYESKREDTTNQALLEKYEKIIPTLRYALTRLVNDWQEIDPEDKEAIAKLSRFDTLPDWALPLKLKYLDDERARNEACEMAIQVIKDKVEREKNSADF